jgi:predicted NodU family carbamoyl transferase
MKQGRPFVELSDDELPNKIADLIASEKVIGWFWGRMEFGPRALGGRSIIGDAYKAAEIEAWLEPDVVRSEQLMAAQ